MIDKITASFPGDNNYEVFELDASEIQIQQDYTGRLVANISVEGLRAEMFKDFVARNGSTDNISVGYRCQTIDDNDSDDRNLLTQSIWQSFNEKVEASLRALTGGGIDYEGDRNE